MAAGTWLCPHCYEEEHPQEGWICNSSICMKRRGYKPTGIAIYDAQQRGFKSVAHWLQAQLCKTGAGGAAASVAVVPPAAVVTAPVVTAAVVSGAAAGCVGGGIKGEEVELAATVVVVGTPEVKKVKKGSGSKGSSGEEVVMEAAAAAGVAPACSDGAMMPVTPFRRSENVLGDEGMSQEEEEGVGGKKAVEVAVAGGGRGTRSLRGGKKVGKENAGAGLVIGKVRGVVKGGGSAVGGRVTRAKGKMALGAC
jgi:hypothetical protein